MGNPYCCAKNYCLALTMVTFSGPLPAYSCIMPPLYHLLALHSESIGKVQETIMIKTTVIACCLFSALVLAACSKPESTPPSTANTNTNKPAASPASSAVTTSSADKIGIAECDDFLAAYESCVNSKVPAAARAQFNTGMAEWRKSWKQLAANPQTKATLAGVCKTQIDAAKTSMKAYGCTF